jgi:hypothetical protein
MQRRVRGFLVGVVLCLGLAAVPGCGSDEGEGTNSGEFARQYCALFQPCCQGAGLAGGGQGCMLLFGSVPVADKVAAESCLAEYEQRAQAPDFCQTLGGPTQPESCARAFPQNELGQPPAGTKQPGEPCEFEDDCAPASNGEAGCSMSFDSGSRTCRVRTRAALGEACVGTRDGNVWMTTGDDTGTTQPFCDRAEGTYCRAGTCAAVVGVGQTCDLDEGCTDQAYCSAGVCTDRVGAGASCSESSAACNEGTYCEIDDDICHARIPEGGACVSATACASGLLCIDDVCGKPNLGGFGGLLLFCS